MEQKPYQGNDWFMPLKLDKNGTMKPKWVHIDSYMPTEPKYRIFVALPNSIRVPISKFFNLGYVDEEFDRFVTSNKKCYNKEVKYHICKYLNYFEQWYDEEHELLEFYARFKSMIDYGIIDRSNQRYQYTQNYFIEDMKKYILSDSMYKKVRKLVEDNYIINLVYRNKNNEGLQYNNQHGKYLMEISFFMNILIPLITHYSYKNKILDMNDIIIFMFKLLFQKYENEVDLMAKLYETISTTVSGNYNTNSQLWIMCMVRGFDVTTFCIDLLNTLVTQSMCKYTFDDNMITFNFSIVSNSIEKSITGIQYEFDMVSLDSSKVEGEDNSSELDKYEAHLTKENEAMYLQSNFNAKKSMEIIEKKFGPFNKNEINFYRQELTAGGKSAYIQFQWRLISNLMYKYFGDTESPKCTNCVQYIELMMASRRILESYNMKQLPYIISGRFDKITAKNSLNKKEVLKLQNSELYHEIIKKYRNPKIIEGILKDIAIILSANISIIDYNNPDLNGKRIEVDSDLILEEFLMYAYII